MLCSLSIRRKSINRQWKWKPHLKELAAVDVVLQDKVAEAPHFPLPLGELLPLHLHLLLVMLPALLHLLKLVGRHFQLGLHANIPSINNFGINQAWYHSWCGAKREGKEQVVFCSLRQSK